MDNPSVVRNPCCNCCVDLQAARLVSLAPAGIRIRQRPARLASHALTTLHPALRSAQSLPPPLGSAGARRGLGMVGGHLVVARSVRSESGFGRPVSFPVAANGSSH